MKIGLIADFVGNSFETSIIEAKKLGVTGVQKYMTNGIFNAWDLDDAKVKEVNDIMKSNGIIFAPAACIPTASPWCARCSALARRISPLPLPSLAESRSVRRF